MIWFQAQGFTQFQITLLLSVFFLSTTLAEIPTGLFSDRFGHHRAMACCGLFQAAGIIVLAFASHWGLATVGELLMGVGQAFYTGSKEAFLFNYLEEDRAAHLYQRDYARAKFFEFIGMAAGSLVGGSIYAFSPRAPFFLSAAAFLLAAVVALNLKTVAVQQAITGSWKNLLSGLSAVRHGSPQLQRLIAYYCGLFTFILIFIVTLVQPYLRGRGIPISLFGILFFLFQSASMAGSFLANRIPEQRVSARFFSALAILLGGSFVGLTLMRGIGSTLWIGGIYFVWGLFLPTTSHATNRLIPSAQRATILSSQDFLQSFLFVLLAPLAGLMTDQWGMTAPLLLLGLGSFAAVAFSRKFAR